MAITQDYLNLKINDYYNSAHTWKVSFINQNLNPLTSTSAQLLAGEAFSVNNVPMVLSPGNPQVISWSFQSSNTTIISNIYVIAVENVTKGLYMHAWAANGAPFSLLPDTYFNLAVQLER